MPGRSWQNMTLKWFLIQSSSAHPCKQTMLKCLHANYCAPIWLLILSLWHTTWPAITVLIRQHSAGSWCHPVQAQDQGLSYVYVQFRWLVQDSPGDGRENGPSSPAGWRLRGRLPVLRCRCTQMQTSYALRSSMQKGVQVEKEKSLFEAIGLAQRMWTDCGMDIW